MIILGMILYYNYLNILVHCCLIIGISGTYLRKIKYSLSDGKSEKFPYIKYLLQYGFYVITVVGIIIFSMLILQSLNSSIQFSIEFGYDFNLLDFIDGLLMGLGPYLAGYPLLISGFIILYFKKKKENMYRLKNLPIRYRFARSWKCRDCENKFRSNIMQCPNCDGENLKQRG